MKKLLPIILLAIAIRVIIPWHEILGGEYIKFTCPDSYYYMNLATTDPTNLLWGWLLQLPAWILARGQLTKGVIERTAIFIAPLMACGVVYFTYLIGKNIFREQVGILAALFVAVIPGEFYGRSILGSCDHHIVEVFLTTGAMACIAIGEKKNNWWYALGTGLFLLLYCTIWQGHFLFIGLLGLYAVVKVWQIGGKWKIVSCVSIIAGALAIWKLGILSQVFHFDPRVLDETLEARSAFSIDGLVSFFLLKCLLTIGLLYFATKTPQIMVWGLVMVGATLWQVRFDYYLVIPLSLLLGNALSKFYGYSLEELSYKAARNVMAVLIVVYLGFCGVYYGTIHISDTTPSDGLCEACYWLRDNSPNYILVGTWWDYGYWIEYMAEREAIADNSQNSQDIDNVNVILKTGVPKVNYILVDKRIASGLGVESYAAELYYSHGDGKYREVYNKSGVKIFERISEYSEMP